MSYSALKLLIVVQVLAITFGGCADEKQTEVHTPVEQSTSANVGKADNAGSLDFKEDILTAADENCSFDPSDRFEPRSRFLQGPWQGQCHDTRQRRPVGLLSDEDREDYPQFEGYLAIYNVYHQDSFWIAFVPEEALSTVYFQLEYFPAIIPAGHTQLRLEYDFPVFLLGQSEANKGRIDEVYDLTLSVEAVTRPGDQYDLIKGTQENFAVAFRVTSMEARYEDMVLRQDHHVEQWRLQLEPAEQQALLFHYVTESTEHQLDYAYHTLFKNCTTEIIRILDEVVQYNWRENIRRFLVKVTEIYPNIVRAALIARNLLPLDQSTDWYPLEEDQDFIEKYQAKAR